MEQRRIGSQSFARLLGEWRPPHGRGLAGALADRVRLLVLDGRLPLQSRVPAERDLADALGVSRTTVAAAYDALRAGGVLHSRRGAGSWTRLPADPAGRADTGGFGPQDAAPTAPDGGLLDLAHAAPAAPSEALRTAAAAALHDLDALLGRHGYDRVGLPVLRDAIARRYTVRGLPTTPDQVLVTAGAQHAITLALAELVAPGDRVLVEHPTYPNALAAITGRGARPVPVPMVDGWDLDLLTAAVRDAAPRLAYLIPDLQNPTGAVLPAADRERVVALARRTGTPLLVDETMTEVWIDEPLPAPVPGAPPVLAVGSASKVFWGGLRVGWIRAEAALVRRLAARRASIDLGGPPLEQLVCARLLDDVDALAAARRTELAAARERLLAGVGELFPAWRPSRPSGGLSTWIDLGEPASSRLTVAARRHGVLLAAGPRFGVDGAFERFLRLPWTLPPDRADDALRRLALAWRGLDAVSEDPGPVAVA